MNQQEKKISINIVLVMFFLFLSCANRPREKDIERALLKKVNFDINSIVNIKCENFESTFKNKLELIEINDTSSLRKLELVLKSLKSDSIGRELDVRAKLILFYSDRTKDSLCMDRFRVTLNGKTFLMKQEFLNFIEEAQ